MEHIKNDSDALALKTYSLLHLTIALTLITL
jgi:hypothetical protein